ncbi:DUF6965 family protein [Dyadobacter bucti]|uniref:DUF6965 family protein n=1 Tax=Dyadobacter bucti TaxID=2572203 RepID=UPI0035B5806D
MSQEYTIDELKLFFDSAKLPEGPVSTNSYSTIHNLEKFVEAQFIQIEHAPRGRHPIPAYLRLVELKEWLEKGDLSV